MKELLEELSDKAALCLATSKPLYFARQILEMRGITSYFTLTAGANLDGTMTDKAQVVGEALRQLGNPPREEAVMIGDRRQDIVGAKAQGLETIGVRYGYSEAGELESAGASRIVPTVEALRELCLMLCG